MAQVNMGSRTLIQTRVPDDLTALIDADAKAAGITRSQYIADLVAARYDVQLPSERFVSRKLCRSRHQEALPLDRAS